MGWCPKKEAVYFRGESPVSDRKIPAPPDGNSRMVDGVIVDYQSKGLPIPIFIGLVVALSVAIQYFFAMYRTIAVSLGVVAFLLAFIIAEVYAARKKSRVGITEDSITLFRPLRRPEVIPRESVEETGVKENTVPLSPKVIGVLTFIILALCIEPVYNMITSGFVHSDPTLVVFGIVVPLILVVLLYRAYSRAIYAKTVVITTAAGKIVAIFTNDPGKITALLEAS
jgi:hypothetical protein